jgi:hypothetical protein
MEHIKELAANAAGTLFVNGSLTWYAIDKTTQGQVSDLLRAVWAYDDLVLACRLHEASNKHLVLCDVCRQNNPCDIWVRLRKMELNARYKALSVARAEIGLVDWGHPIS